MHTLKVINDRAAFLSNILPLPYKWCLFAPTLASKSEFRHSCSNAVWTDKEFAIQQGKRSAPVFPVQACTQVLSQWGWTPSTEPHR